MVVITSNHMVEQTPKQQTIELIKSAKRILIMGHQSPDGDSLGSTLALTLALRKLGKETVAIAADPVPNTFKFLPGSGEVTDQLSVQSDFVISVDTTDVEIDKLGYKNHADQRKLNIVIKTNSGQLTPERVSFGSAGASADLIIAVDTNDVGRLGSIYEKYSQIFYQTPIVNIDHHPGNAYFGKVNWVDLTATSTAEILVSLVEALGQLPQVDPASPQASEGRSGAQGKSSSLLDADIATLLLTGLTTDTGSFQNTNTTPKSFTVAAQLVAAGARQQEIVQHIYKTKPLSTLKLWGKILSSIHDESVSRFVYSTVSATDFKTFEASESETSGVVDELLKTVPGIDFALLLSEKKEGLYGSLRGVNTDVSVSEIAGLFGGGGHKMAAAFRIPNGSLVENEREVVDKIKEYQAKPAATEKSEDKSQKPEPQAAAASGQTTAVTNSSKPVSDESTAEAIEAVRQSMNPAPEPASPEPLISSSESITASSPAASQQTVPNVDTAATRTSSTPAAETGETSPDMAKQPIPDYDSLKAAQAALQA